MYGDGDNLGIALGSTAQNIRDSELPCRERNCSSIGWSVSPHLPELAGAPFDWILERVGRMGSDIVLPPSGYLYSYPSMMREDVQRVYAKRTMEAARRLGTRAVSTWEWFFDWGRAMGDYLPLYADGELCFFALNVPYFFPILGLGYGLRSPPRVFNRYFAWYGGLNKVPHEEVAGESEPGGPR